MDHDSWLSPSSSKSPSRLRKVRDANDKIPAANRLPAADLVVDEALREIYQRRSDDAVALLRREMAFESEKQSIARDKLYDRFFKDMESNRVELKVMLRMRGEGRYFFH